MLHCRSDLSTRSLAVAIVHDVRTSRGDARIRLLIVSVITARENPTNSCFESTFGTRRSCEPLQHTERDDRRDPASESAVFDDINGLQTSFDPIERRFGVLAEILDPGLLRARIMLGGLHEIHEVDHRRVEAAKELGVGDPPRVVEGSVRLRQGERVGEYARPEMLKRHPKCPQATVAAAIDGDRRMPWSSLNGCGLNRETQSMAFLSAPGIDALYSGDEMTKASQPTRRRRNSSDPGGHVPSSWTSALYEGASKSDIDAWLTSPPLASMQSAASRAS